MPSIGRKPVIVLALSGITLNLLCSMTVLWFWTVVPLQLIWLAGLFPLLGGGQAIVVSIPRCTTPFLWGVFRCR